MESRGKGNPWISPIGPTAEEARNRDRQENHDYALEEKNLAHASAIAHAIILARTERNLTQAQLAKMIDTKSPAISRIESGRHLPSLATLTKIAEALKLDLRVELAPRPQGRSRRTRRSTVKRALAV